MSCRSTKTSILNSLSIELTRNALRLIPRGIDIDQFDTVDTDTYNGLLSDDFCLFAQFFLKSRQQLNVNFFGVHTRKQTDQ